MEVYRVMLNEERVSVQTLNMLHVCCSLLRGLCIFLLLSSGLLLMIVAGMFI
jgi:hypothetical protein